MPQLIAPHPHCASLLVDPAVQQAAQALAGGKLLGLPTETVYGLAADAHQPDAVARIFAMKGRPSDHPLIVHLPPDWQAGVAHHTTHVPDFALRLMQACWPGPLTLILPRQPHVAAAAAGGQNSIGLRCPAHPVAQAVLQVAWGLGVRGVAAPSANRFGRVSPTQAQHVMDEFAHVPAHSLLVLDAGACQVGIESTIVDATRGQPIVLRPGMISLPELQRICQQPVFMADDFNAKAAAPSPKASGTLASHYAPNARVRMMPWPQLCQAISLLPPASWAHMAVYSQHPPPQPALRWQTMPQQAHECAQELFAVLRQLDSPQTQVIWVQEPPQTPDWAGVLDRLSRACA